MIHCRHQLECLPWHSLPAVPVNQNKPFNGHAVRKSISDACTSTDPLPIFFVEIPLEICTLTGQWANSEINAADSINEKSLKSFLQKQ